MILDDIYYCDKCESIIDSDLGLNPDRALELHLDGGYGMFVDLTKIDLLFCHSCSVEFFRTIPSLSADKINGMHSVSYKSKDFPLCCEYSWMIEENNEVKLGAKENFDNRRQND